MEKILTLIIIGFLAAGCYSPKVNQHETAAYKSASPENKQRIEQGKIAVGMSIEESKASCPGYQFVNKFTSSNGSYELWEANNRQGKAFYLHVENGRIEKISEYQVQTTPQYKRAKGSGIKDKLLGN